MKIVLILVGVVIGAILACVGMLGLKMGTIRVDQSDPDDDPYLFLELERPVAAMRRKKFVLLRVCIKNYISHE